MIVFFVEKELLGGYCKRIDKLWIRMEIVEVKRNVGIDVYCGG